jgi:hypothetical protein
MPSIKICDNSDHGCRKRVPSHKKYCPGCENPWHVIHREGDELVYATERFK